jgi:hypothetical protein
MCVCVCVCVEYGEEGDKMVWYDFILLFFFFPLFTPIIFFLTAFLYSMTIFPFWKFFLIGFGLGFGVLARLFFEFLFFARRYDTIPEKLL